MALCAREIPSRRDMSHVPPICARGCTTGFSRPAPFNSVALRKLAQSVTIHLTLCDIPCQRRPSLLSVCRSRSLKRYLNFIGARSAAAAAVEGNFLSARRRLRTNRARTLYTNHFACTCKIHMKQVIHAANVRRRIRDGSSSSSSSHCAA